MLTQLTHTYSEINQPGNPCSRRCKTEASITKANIHCR